MMINWFICSFLGSQELHSRQPTALASKFRWLQWRPWKLNYWHRKTQIISQFPWPWLVMMMMVMMMMMMVMMMMMRVVIEIKTNNDFSAPSTDAVWVNEAAGASFRLIEIISIIIIGIIAILTIMIMMIINISITPRVVQGLTPLQAKPSPQTTSDSPLSMGKCR